MNDREQSGESAADLLERVAQLAGWTDGRQLVELDFKDGRIRRARVVPPTESLSIRPS